MKKGVKNAFLVAIVLVVLIVGFLGAMTVRFVMETRKMSPLPTGIVAEGVYAVKDDYVNLFVIKKGDSIVVVDGAIDAGVVSAELAKLKIDPAQVRAVFLTHTDNDHVAAVGLFPRAKVYIGTEEEQLLDGRLHRMLIFNNSLTRSYEKLADGQVIVLGDIRVKAISTPGHTPGSFCFLVNDSLLFTGDTLALRDGAAMTFNELFNMDTATEETTIRSRIAPLRGVKYVFTAHYGFSDNFAKVFAAWQK
ncbi:MAG: MBL fold metallo-hydrolase [Spirochaetes bacterium]|nr:MAG: MBL fold metallo-hydrolase [Spirochaetota bacterium]